MVCRWQWTICQQQQQHNSHHPYYPHPYHETPVSSDPGTPISSDPHLKIPVSSCEPNPFLSSSHSALKVHSGVVVTESIKFNKQQHLYDFFIHYNVAECKACGHDSMVGIPSDAEVERAKSIVPELMDKQSFMTLTISDQCFITYCPKSQLHVPVGCWTCTSFTFDISNECQVLLKDFWHALLDGIMPEGDIYLQLHERGVPNIPHCLLCSDVGHNHYHQSQTQEVKDEYFTHHIYWQLTLH